MLHTIYAAKLEQTIIHQHVHLRRKSQSHAPAHVLMRLYPIDKSLVSYQNRNKSLKPEYVLSFNMGWRILVKFIPRLWLGIKY
jgi:hypothetical protein